MRRLRVGLMVLLSALAACRPSPREQPHDDRTWHAPSTGPTAPEWPDFSQKEYVELRLPESPGSELDLVDPETPFPRLILTLTADGLVQFKGNSYAWHDADRAEAAEADLASFLAALIDNPRWRAPDGASRVRVMVAADRAAPWRWAARLLRVVTDPARGSGHLQIAARGAARREARLGATALPLSAEAADATRLRLVLATREGATGPDGPPVRLSVGDDAFDFPGAAFDDEAFLEIANARWREVSAAIGKRAAEHRAALDVASPDVPWGYVVTAIGVLRTAGIDEIPLPGAGLLLLASADAPAPRFVPMVHGGPSVGLLVACVAIALLAGWFVLAPWRRRRPGRPRHAR